MLARATQAVAEAGLARDWHDCAAARLGSDPAELKLPVIKLIGAKKLKAKGQRRGTKHFAK